MRPLISEFSYGYAITEEFVRGIRGQLYGAPVFPSLRQEGNVGGYDVELPIRASPLFVQFKLSHFLTRSYSLEWALHRTPYYRMYLRPRRRSDQHRLLIEWEAQGNQVLYATPVFHTQDELNDAYLNERVVARSAFFRPSDIGPLPDDNEHYLTFTPGSQNAYFHSKEPLPLKPPIFGFELLVDQLPIVKQHKRSVDIDLFETLARRLGEMAAGADYPLEKMRLLDHDRYRDRGTILESAAYASFATWLILDAQLLLLFEPNDFRP